ncbi:MAG: MarR family winged helix-turn-helix transcriptional regulator [Betaproteobacteria bacterium]|nr:MarR family winged helix-turn-helix transcriptional regulator [Betaproteobacteria bacterium]
MSENDSPLSTPLLAMEVLQQFRLIFGSLRQYFRLVEERCDMSGSQMWVLQEVARSPGLGIGELAGRMGIHQSTCSLLVDKLVGRGCLVKQRNGRDQRRVGLHLAANGATALAALPGPAEGILPQALSALPAVTLKTLHINLEELIRLLPGRDEAAAGMPLAELLTPPDGPPGGG